MSIIMKGNKARFEYREEHVVWTLYDDFTPTGIDVKSTRFEIDSNSPIEDYFNTFTKFLNEIGFSKEEIKSCAFQLNYYDQVPRKVEQTQKEGVRETLGNFLED